MERGNYRILRIIVSFELSILFYLIIIISRTPIKEKEELNVDFHDIEEKIAFYKDLDNQINLKYEEYTDNIAKLEKKVKNKETKVKIAYLTFDDGPYDLTSKVLDVLKKNNVRATFFVLGKRSYIDTYKRIVNEDHVLANHTYYHNIWKGLYKSKDSFMSQVKQLEKLIYENTNYKTTLVRFPGGSNTAGKLKTSIVNELHKNGYNYVDWTCITGDGSDEQLAQHNTWYWYTKTCNQDIMVILMHDYNYSTYTILDKVIKDLRSKGYVLLPLTNKSIMAK